MENFKTFKSRKTYEVIFYIMTFDLKLQIIQLFSTTGGTLLYYFHSALWTKIIALSSTFLRGIYRINELEELRRLIGEQRIIINKT